MHITPKGRSLRSLTAALAVTAVAAVGLAMPAAAAPIIPSPAPPVTLTVHKFAQPVAPGAPANGLVQDTSGLTPLVGIEFQIQQVPGIDLTTSTGWEDATTLSQSPTAVADAQALVTAVAAIKRTTIAGGSAVFSTSGVASNTAGTPLPVGLYLVTENLTAAQLASGITGGEPFLVTLPLTHPTALNTWIYDVNVYPKNNVDTITKTVVDEDAVKLGDNVAWTILGAIPAGGETDRYVITDQLDAKLDFTSAVVSLDGATVVPNTLDAGDYTITPATATADGPLVTVEFTAAGRANLAAIKAANPTAQVKVVVNTTVNTIGEIANSAILYPNSTNVAGIPSTPVITKWGSVTIEKRGLEAGTPLLGGAEFKVYTSEAAALAGAVGTEVTIDGVNTWTTSTVPGADFGRVTISGLRYSNWENGAAIALPADYQSYWLVETKAPAGHELLTAPIKFDITAATTDLTTIQEISNAPHNAGFELPLTGGAGTAVFSIVGLAMIALAGGLFLRSRKRVNA